MNKQYLRNGLEYYMEVEPMGGEVYEYHMLKENQIDNLLPLQIKQVNQRQYLQYSAMGVKPFWITIQKMWITGEQLYVLVDSLLHTLKELNRYFLLADNLVLELECLFLDLSQFQFHFLYVPGYQQDIFIQMKKLIEYLVGRIDYKEKVGAMFGYGLYRLLKEETTDLEEIRIYLEQNSTVLSDKSKLTEGKEKKEQKKNDTQICPDKNQTHIQYRTLTAKDDGMLEQEANIEKSFSNSDCTKEEREAQKKRQASFWKILFFGVIWVVLMIALAIILYLIYWYGILEWKRNCLIVLIFLFVIDSIFLFLQWKKKKQEEEVAVIFQSSKNKNDFKMPYLEDEAERKEGRKEMMYSEIYSNIQGEIPQNKVILDGTMILTGNESEKRIPRLIPCNHEAESEIFLTKFPFTIGSYHTGIDYQLNKKQISRFHASITKSEENFRIKDLHSTNGTFVNDKRLNGEEEQTILTGDIIRFADLNYRFME